MGAEPSPPQCKKAIFIGISLKILTAFVAVLEQFLPDCEAMDCCSTHNIS